MILMPEAFCCPQAEPTRLLTPAANPFSGSLASASAIPVAFKARQKPPTALEGVEKTVSLATLPLTPSWAVPKSFATSASGGLPAELEIPGLASASKDDGQPGTSRQHASRATQDYSQVDSQRVDALQQRGVLDPAISGNSGQILSLCTVHFFASSLRLSAVSESQLLTLFEKAYQSLEDEP